MENVKQPELKKHDASVLDLAFVMDCTGSMGQYIENARNVMENNKIIVPTKINILIS